MGVAFGVDLSSTSVYSLNLLSLVQTLALRGAQEHKKVGGNLLIFMLPVLNLSYDCPEFSIPDTNAQNEFLNLR